MNVWRAKGLRIIRDENFSKIVFISVFFFLYVVNFTNVALAVSLKKIYLLLLSFYSIAFLVLNSRRISVLSRTFIFLAVSFALVFYSYTSREELLTDLLLYLILVAIFEVEIVFTKIFLRRLTVVIFFGIVINVVLHWHLPRISVGGLDPNYTSYILYLFMGTVYKVFGNVLPTTPVALVAISTLSRAFILSYFFWLLSFWNWQMVRRVPRHFITFLPLILLFLFTCWVILNPIQYKYFNGIDEFIGYAYNLIGEKARIFNFIQNESDYKRHLANMNYLGWLWDHPEAILWGHDVVNYENTVYQYAPHNIYLLQFLKSGFLIGVATLFYFFKKLHGLTINSENFILLIGIAPYFAFLGIEIASIYTLALALLLKVNLKEVDSKC